MKKTLFVLILVLVMLTTTVFAATVAETNTADAMNHLGLFLGTGKGYELDSGLTRAQGITLLVRMIGKEEEANNGIYNNPLTDVPAWAAGYIGYAYENAITNGISETKFGSDQPMTDYMFLTLTLRALGYSDSGEEPLYTWNNPYAVAHELGLIEQAVADSTFTRGDAVSVFWNAMNVKINGTEQTLSARLVEQDIFTAEELTEAKDIYENGLVKDSEEPEEEAPAPEEEPEFEIPNPELDGYVRDEDEGDLDWH